MIQNARGVCVVSFWNTNCVDDSGESSTPVVTVDLWQEQSHERNPE